MNYYLLIITAIIITMFARIMFINRNNPKIEIEPEVIYKENDFYDDNLD